MKLLLIRHGESVGNAEHRVQGQAEFPLTERGRDQTRALARRLRRETWMLSVLYASDLSRAAETAEILAAEMEAQVVLDARLREYHAGVLNGIVWKEIEFLYPDIWHGLRHSPEWVPIPEEEGTEAFHARIATALENIQDRHKGTAATAVVSHGGTLGMILSHLLGMDPSRPTPFRFGNTSLSIVEFGPRGPRLTLMNDTCHLDGDLQ